MKTVLLLTTLVLSGPVLAHGHHDWIRQNPVTNFCCGEDDCIVVEADEVRFDQVWFVRGRVVPPDNVFPSVDVLYHACFRDPGSWRIPRCLFVPGVS